jgi:hypothetical protein
MNSSDWIALAGVVSTVAGLFGGLFAFALRATMAPVKVSVDNLAKVMSEISSTLGEHEYKLDDHGQRLVAIETTHRVKGC